MVFCPRGSRCKSRYRGRLSILSSRSRTDVPTLSEDENDQEDDDTEEGGEAEPVDLVGESRLYVFNEFSI